MTLFYREYTNFNLIGPQPVGQLQTSKLKKSKKSPQAVGQIQEAANTNLQHLVTGLPWGHNVLLMEKIKDRQGREWYMSQCLKHGWSRNILDIHIKNHSYERRGKATTNFDRTLPPIHSDMAQQTLKDPYIFDFLTIGNKFRERELKTELLKHIQEFLIELGVGFAFEYQLTQILPEELKSSLPTVDEIERELGRKE